MAGEITLHKSTRASTSKSRTGCITCKARRVKCDERKPSCKRCTRSGRTCEGYGSPPNHSRQPLRFTVYTPPIQQHPLRAVSSSEIDFYHHRVASTLSGYFDLEFWHVLIMQLSQSEEAIRHAITAISAVHINVSAGDAASPTVFNRPNAIVLKSSTAAMRSLTEKIAANPNERLIPLVACILFTCLEFLQGSVDSAMVHMQGGLKILNAARAHAATSTDGPNSDIYAIERHVAPVLSRLNLLCTLFDRKMPPLYLALPQGEFHLQTLPEARKALFDIMDAALRFIKEADPLVVNTDEHHFDHRRKAALEEQLEQWYDAFERLEKQASDAGRPFDETAINLLRIQHRVVYLWLVSSTSRAETPLDKYMADFVAILKYASQITAHVGPGKAQARLENFSFEMKIIPALFYVAIRCRVPSLRRRAIALLHLAPLRESLWNAQLAIKIAECIIEIEEAGLPVRFTGLVDGCSLHDENQLRAEVLPSEKARIHGLSVLPGHVVQAHNVDVSSDKYERVPERITVTFITMPQGLDREPHRLNRDIYL